MRQTPMLVDFPIREEPLATDFAKGADISWVTEMEHKGMKFYNTSGVETDCFQLMKDLGTECGSTQSMGRPQRTR
ncbi:glycosyl hydrolase 53 family protein [Bacteroides uniformis]|nr:glycosyl hydrolase 53 family protein [Bacteroides uniformis]